MKNENWVMFDGEVYINKKLENKINKQTKGRGKKREENN